MCRIQYKINGYPHDLYGIVKKSYTVRFGFLVNGGNEIKIRFENIVNIEAI